jgi:SAM-dependent methyltransferase
MRPCFCCNSIINANLLSLNLQLIDDINLNKNINVKYCQDCYFYFSESNNTQDDYNYYYQNFNKYNTDSVSIDKDQKCVDYLLSNLDNNIKTILDYGCGNGLISQKLKEIYTVNTFDIGMKDPDIKYDCIIINHVLEHIYDLDDFISKIKVNIIDNGVVYIEIPNAEYYEEFNNFGPLQEINLEHINYFSKLALSKLMVKHNFIPLKLEDDYFIINNSKYYVIRGLFKLNHNNKSFEKYIEYGRNKIENIQFDDKINNKSIYVYGCGQYLFKIFNKISEKYNIINIIDDNPSYLHKKVNNVLIINYDEFKNTIESKKEINVLIATLNHKNKIMDKLNQISNINFINIV